MKRIIAVALSVAMVTSSLSTPVFAEGLSASGVGEEFFISGETETGEGAADSAETQEATETDVETQSDQYQDESVQPDQFQGELVQADPSLSDDGLLTTSDSVIKEIDSVDDFVMPTGYIPSETDYNQPALDPSVEPEDLAEVLIKKILEATAQRAYPEMK